MNEDQNLNSAGKINDVVQAAKLHQQQANDFESSVRDSFREAIRFVREGKQWPDDVRMQRDQPGQQRPCLTFNRLKEFNRQTINGIRQNTPSIKVRPVGGGADKDTADIYDGLIRQIQRLYRADIQYEEAASWAVDGGVDYLVVSVDYVSDDSFDRVPTIKSVPDPMRVFFDHLSTQPDGSDARQALIVTEMPRDRFDKEYPRQEARDWEALESGSDAAAWYGKEVVTLAEFYRIEYTEDVLLGFGNGQTAYASEMPQELQFQATRRRPVQRHRLTMTGGPATRKTSS